MSAAVYNKVLDDAIRNGYLSVKDPGASGTIEFGNKGDGICEVVTAAAESRALEAASRFMTGHRLMVVLKTAGGALTVTGGNEGSVILATAGDFVEYLLVDANGTKQWRIEQLSLATASISGTRDFGVMTVETAVDDTATVTAAQLLKRILDSVPTAAAAFALPTAALLVAAIPNAKVGDSFSFIITNNSAGANTITVSAGSGGTGDGTLTVAQNVCRLFIVTITNVTAAAEAYLVFGIGA